MPKSKVQFRPIKLRGKVSLDKKRVKNQTGDAEVFYTLDADSPHFARDLRAVFAKSVVTARQANSELSPTVMRTIRKPLKDSSPTVVIGKSKKKKKTAKT
jgi:hypothetical protein